MSEVKKEVYNHRMYFEKVAQKTDRVASIIPFIWSVLPIYVMIHFFLLTLSKPEKYHVLNVMYIFYKPTFTQIFRILGWVTIIATILCMVSTIFCGKCNLKMYFKKSPWFLFIIIFLLWATISTAFSGYSNLEWYGTSYRNEGLFSYLVYFSLFCCSGKLVGSKKIKQLLSLFSLVGNATALLVILQDMNIPKVIEYFPYLKAGIFYNSNHCAYYLTMTILSLLGLYLFEMRIWCKLVYLASMGFQFYSLLKNDTFGCFLAVWFGAGVIYLLILLSGRKMRIYDLIPVFLMIGTSILESGVVTRNVQTLSTDVTNIVEKDENMGSAGSGRMALWLNALERIKEKPIWGYGPEGLYYAFPDSALSDRPHNEYLQYAVFFGIPGAILYLLSLLSLARRRIQELKRLDSMIIIAGAVMIGYLVSAMFGNTMFYTSPYFFMIFGIVGYAVGDEHQSSR